MPNKKSRLLVLQKLFRQHTDEEHRLAAPELLRLLQAQGLAADRKSLYDDIDALRQAGEDIQLTRGKDGGYWLGSRLFELPELKLLVDAVQASRFITVQKSARLIKKLESLASLYQAGQLQRQVTVDGRAKAVNERIYYVVDCIHTAITAQCQLSFLYRAWAVDPNAPGGFSAKDRHGGKRYVVSPWALVWMEENYYLVAFEEASQAIRHYRVDKMHSQQLLDTPRRGQQQFERFDLASYTQSLFGMFGGQAEEVCLEMENHLVGVLADRFGRGLTVCPAARPGWFTVRLRVVPGPAFYGWVMSFGAGARLLSPAPVRAALGRYAAQLAQLYPAEGTAAAEAAAAAERTAGAEGPAAAEGAASAEGPAAAEGAGPAEEHTGAEDAAGTAEHTCTKDAAAIAAAGAAAAKSANPAEDPAGAAAESAGPAEDAPPR